MPKRNSKGRFIKGGRKSRARRSSSHAMTTTRSAPPRRRAASHAPRRRRHAKSGGHGVKVLPLFLATAGLAYVTSEAHGVQGVKDFAAKIPGSKTFGASATLGLACLAADRFIKPNKWLRYLGYAGLVMAATKVGSQGADFKWVGDDEGSSGDFDLADDGDMGDDDMGDDDIGDDE